MDSPDMKDAKGAEAEKKAPARKFEGTLPMGRPGQPVPPRTADGELDLDLGDIQTRLPYGSEDIADK
jgi:hypothetical protein